MSVKYKGNGRKKEISPKYSKDEIIEFYSCKYSDIKDKDSILDIEILSPQAITWKSKMILYQNVHNLQSIVQFCNIELEKLLLQFLYSFQSFYSSVLSLDL